VLPLSFGPRAATVKSFLHALGVAGINISQTVHDNITHEIRMSLEAVSHWGVLVIDDENGKTFQWDLMSDETWKPFKIVIYRNTITQELAAKWSHSVEIGHTTKTDEMIRQTGAS